MYCNMCNSELATYNHYSITQDNVEKYVCGPCFMLVRIYETLQDLKKVIGEEEQDGSN